MKRYRVLVSDFDARARCFDEILETWDEQVKQLHRRNRAEVQNALLIQFGQSFAAQKQINFVELGTKFPSILAFHNRFFEQIRGAFVMGAYYPALTASCALGERILNHLVLNLREDFKSTPEYKRVYSKSSFDNWDIPINTLNAWNILLPEVVSEFRTLCKLRNDAIHFNPDVDYNDRPIALRAINSLASILCLQFGGFGTQRWFITDVPGETYIKKSQESDPFIRKIYLPRCRAVGPRHNVTEVMTWQIEDHSEYDGREISDEEFCELRRTYIGNGISCRFKP